MTKIKLKRVFDKHEEHDGLRVLVDRLWPRGIKKEALHYDIWEKEIAPSTVLRKWVHADKGTRWIEFTALYQAELNQSEFLRIFIEKIRHYEIVTLLYATRDEIQNHAVILKNVLESRL